MKVWKIVHKERDHAKIWRKVYSIVPADSRDEALKRVDRHSSLIYSVTFLGEQRENDYDKYWKIWEERLEERHKNLKYKIYKLK